MTIDQFITRMQLLGFTDQDITYLLDLENIRQANGLYADLDTLASLIERLARPRPLLCEDLANNDTGTAVLT